MLKIEDLFTEFNKFLSVAANELFVDFNTLPVCCA